MFLLSTPRKSKSKSKSLKRNTTESKFKKWRKLNPQNRQLKWVSSTPKEHQLIFSINSTNYTLSYPTSKDPESSFFLEGPDGLWENDVNEWVFSETPTELALVLDRILSCAGLNKAEDADEYLVGGDDSMDEDEANARQFGVGTNWFINPPNHWFCSKVVKEVKGARSLLGEDSVKTSGLGFLAVSVDITDFLDPKMAIALELFQEPCHIEFDFDPFWQLKESDRVPLPVIRCRQMTNNDTNLFGVSFHLKEIVLRYLEDHFKWSEKPLISLGSFDSNKGINQAFKSSRPSLKTPVAGNPQAPAVAVDQIMVSQLQQLGFKKSAIEQCLLQSKNRYEVAVDKLISMGQSAIDPGAHESSGNTRLQDEIIEMGFSRDQAIAALKKTKNNVEDAISYLLSDGDQEFQMHVKKEQENILRNSGGSANDMAPQLSRSDTNLFVGLAAYLKMRLKHYMRFCMICHKRHACHNDKPVLCCNPLCIFRYAEMLPQSKKEKMKEVDRITICPFTNCDSMAREDNMGDLLAAFGDSVALEDGNNQQQMLAMQSHRYLPNDEVMKFINVGVKNSGQTISRIENVLKPELVVAFEAQWEKMKKSRGMKEAAPNIAYHGTAEANINSILERGLLVPGRGAGKDVTHATDTGWWGKGIYLAPDPALSIGYCRGGKKLLICSVLMGKRYTVVDRMDGKDCVSGYDSHVACSGAEWIVFEPSQVLPCYLVSFKT